MEKKGQASAAAALIAIIAGLIVLYILFIPPAERERLLDGTSSGGTSTSGGNVVPKAENIILLSESIGRLYPEITEEFQQSFSSTTLFTKEDAVELKRVESVYAQKSLFSEKNAVVNFDIADINNLQDVLLNFIVGERKGYLMIYLNQHLIFNNKITKINIDPIDLKKEGYLKDGINVLEFKVSSPGVQFWANNRYLLQGLTITSTVIGRDTQTSTQTFAVTEDKLNSLKTVRLRFAADCIQDNIGRLDIWVNDYNLFSSVPDCNQMNMPIEFLPSRLIAGENELRFSSSSGRFLIDQIELSSTLKESKPQTFFFDIDKKYFSGEKDSGKDYEYYCGTDDETIYMDYKGNEQRTGWKCDSDKTCRGNYRKYRTQQSQSTVKAALCEEDEYDDDDTYRYYCDNDEDGIYIRSNTADERTGWLCDAGKTCVGNFKRYNKEQSKTTVKAALCEDIGTGYEIGSNVDVTLKVKFEDDVSRKRAEIRINRHIFEIDQRDIDYERSIKNYVEEGANSIKIVPEDILDIAELKVELDTIIK